MDVIHITDNAATVVLIDVGRTPQTSQSVKLRSHSVKLKSAETVVLSDMEDTSNFSVSQAKESRLTTPIMGVIHGNDNEETVVLSDMEDTSNFSVSQATESRLTTPIMGVIHGNDNEETVVLSDVERTHRTSQSVKLRSHD
ncbi:hypothetical protein J6590_037725 [Homalodisca vitripennis]|nr:hypothetical protein J6590_037725 [Homalodisca vitripennis]